MTKVIEAITQKLAANTDLVEKSKAGHVIWRVEANGTVTIKLQPEL